MDFYRLKAFISEAFPEQKEFLRDSYARLPYKWRMNRTFWDNYNFLKQTEHWSEEQVRDFEENRLRNIVNYAFTHVPYYRETYRKAGFLLGDFKTSDDLKYLPMVTKEDIKNNIEKFVSDLAPKNKLLSRYTGGSMATPLKFYSTYEKGWEEISYFYYYLEKAGVRLYADKMVKLKGDKIADVDRRIFHKYDRFDNHLMMDSDYLNRPEFIDYYLEPIRKFGAKILFGFPSSVYQLAKTLRAAGKPPLQFDVIWLASENVYEDQKQYFKEEFGANKILTHFGHSEQVLLAMQDVDTEIMHFIPEYGHVEVIGEDGSNLINSNNNEGELVGTNYVSCMPFIRYRTNDFAVTTTARVKQFPAHYCVKEVLGRLQEFIVTRDKRLVSICTMGAAHFKELEKTLENQYYQEKPGEVVFKIVENPTNTINEAEVRKIKASLIEKMEGAVDVKVEKVSSLTRLNSNKKSMIDQKLDISSYL